MDEFIMNQFMDFESSSKRIEQLNRKETFIHAMNPFVKILITVLYLALILSYSRYNLDGLIIFCAFPILGLLVAEIPIRDVMKRVSMTLPFLLLIGISNLIMDRATVFNISGFVITKGMISFVSILLKTGMSVSSIYLLIATTKSSKLLMGFQMLHIPNMFLIQFELIFRYIGVLVEEARNMYYAYRLRTPGIKGIVIRHMGAFLGQLLLKSIYRAERIYHAMKCRGYSGKISAFSKEKLKRKDYLQLLVISMILILCRLFKVF